MGGITIPYESGQSGTERPEPVLVTSPPTNTRASVPSKATTAKRARPFFFRRAGGVGEWYTRLCLAGMCGREWRVGGSGSDREGVIATEYLVSSHSQQGKRRARRPPPMASDRKCLWAKD